MCVCVCAPARAPGLGGRHLTHRRVLALPPGPPHLPGSCAGLLPLLLATSLLLLLSLLWAQTQPVKPGLDPRALPSVPPAGQPHFQGCATLVPLAGMVFTRFLTGRAGPPLRAESTLPSGDFRAAPLPQQNAALPWVDTFSEPQNHNTCSDKEFVSGYEFIYMKKI